MKLFFFSCVSRINVLMILYSLGVITFSFPVMAVPQEVCIKTSAGDIVCGTPVPKPKSNINRISREPSVARDNIVTWELQSCTKGEGSFVRCSFSLSTSQDAKYTVISKEGSGPNGGCKLVDSSGNEYRVSRIQMGNKFAGGDDELVFNMVKGSTYKITIDFANVPASVSRATLFTVGTYATVGGWGGVKFRNVPVD